MADMEIHEYGAFVPAWRPTEASEVARAVARLLLEEASYINAAVLPVHDEMIAGLSRIALLRSPGSACAHHTPQPVVHKAGVTWWYSPGTHAQLPSCTDTSKYLISNYLCVLDNFFGAGLLHFLATRPLVEWLMVGAFV